MLRKLIKHELRATGRLMLPIYIAVLVLALFSNLSIRILESGETFVLSSLAGFVLAAFVLALFAAAVMSLVLMIQRFYKNLLTDEGYLMCTLPVSMHKIIWSKLLVSTLWYLCTGLVSVLSLFVLAFRASLVSEVWKELRYVVSWIAKYFNFNISLLMAELAIAALLGVFFLCLLCYASMAMGQSFSNRKLLLSVVFYFVFTTALNILGTALMGALIPISYGALFNDLVLRLGIQGMALVAVLLMILVELLLCSFFYLLTYRRMTRRLNLQ